MIEKTSLLSRAGLAALSPAKRAVLLLGAAVGGTAVAATASYGVVSLLYPRQAAPVVIATPLPLAPVPQERTTERRLPAPAHNDRQIDVAPLGQPVTIVAATEAPPMILAPVEQAPEAVAPAGTEMVVASKSEPTVRLPDPAPLETQVAQSRPVARPDTAPVADVAALAGADATLRDRATLHFGAPAEPATDIFASAPVADPSMPRLRPAARPDDLARFAAQVEPADAIPALRPQPRPEMMLQLAAAEAPAARTNTARSASPSGLCGSTLARAIPRRPSGATTGSAFFAGLGGLSGTERDQRVIDELARGNVPNFLRDLQPVTFRGQDARGADTEIVVCVTPDYLALGSDRDYVRVPLGLPAAARIAGRFDMTLPTPRIVDAVYAQADVRLSPSPMQPGPQMSSTPYLLRHNTTIEGQLHGRGGLVAGQKKDVVMASRMANAPGRVAIYGWHRSATSPIQPVSTVHGANYADYSHGIRLVSKTAFLNGRAVSLDELLSSSRYAYLLNKEGPLPGPVIRTASR